MRIYNTLTRQKEELTPLHEGEFRIYACGPTVYNYIHIGNALPLCVFDVLRRFLEYRGLRVNFVQNFTDVDDKIIRRANEEGVAFGEISERFIREYWTDAKGLNIRPATAHPKATENIGGILAMIETLIAKGHAYAVEGDVYFSPGTFAGYGKLSHQPLEDLEAGARIMVGEIKREPMDFALWKAAKPGEPAWDSPWGQGRPGWHIECSAMARQLLGETIDIHCGGQDLIFPHHENEIAQSECCNGVPFARYWMHNGYINVDNVKMSKSVGNFFTVREVAEKYGYEPIRFLLIASHYRSPVNYSVESVEQAKASLQRLYTCRNNLDFAAANAGAAASPEDAALLEKLAQRRAQFIAAMEEDLNTADALGAIFELVREINVQVLEAGASRAVCQGAAALLDELTGVLGLLYEHLEADQAPDAQAEALVAERTAARQAKDWARADAIRDQLKALGFTVEDTPQGAKLVRI
ncbi:MAG: cysteine--tRNA ligase [Oscillospiraceae bacterium]|jgi:cysteinyl-tRNA synthetase|nr:cysteine--tRNA ligase [Oscillospiraceae bacterium]